MYYLLLILVKVVERKRSGDRYLVLNYRYLITSSSCLAERVNIRGLEINRVRASPSAFIWSSCFTLTPPSLSRALLPITVCRLSAKWKQRSYANIIWELINMLITLMISSDRTCLAVQGMFATGLCLPPFNQTQNLLRQSVIAWKTQCQVLRSQPFISWIISVLDRSRNWNVPKN